MESGKTGHPGAYAHLLVAEANGQGLDHAVPLSMVGACVMGQSHRQRSATSLCAQVSTTPSLKSLSIVCYATGTIHSSLSPMRPFSQVLVDPYLHPMLMPLFHSLQYPCPTIIHPFWNVRLQIQTIYCFIGWEGFWFMSNFDLIFKVMLPCFL